MQKLMTVANNLRWRAQSANTSPAHLEYLELIAREDQIYKIQVEESQRTENLSQFTGSNMRSLVFDFN